MTTIEDKFWCAMMFAVLYIFLFMWFAIENNAYSNPFYQL